MRKELIDAVTFERPKTGCRANVDAETPSGRAWFSGTSDSPVGAVLQAMQVIKKEPRNYGRRGGRYTTVYSVAGDLKWPWKSK